MRTKDRELARVILKKIATFAHRLPGIQSGNAREVLVEQILESLRRVRYRDVLVAKRIDETCGDPASVAFDPLKAAILRSRSGDLDEALWLIFLFVHFGYHPRARWRYASEVYGRLGQGGRWGWADVSCSVEEFRDWMDSYRDWLAGRTPHGFGSHRRRESLSGWSDNGTGSVVASYVDWVGPERKHAAVVHVAACEAGSDPRRLFSVLYRSLDKVHRFGRLAKFDYLAAAGKLKVIEVVPDSAYLTGSSGPRRGAQLLFGGGGGTVPIHELEQLAVELGRHLGVDMQVVEDSLCNWQKSPHVFKAFRG